MEIGVMTGLSHAEAGLRYNEQAVAPGAQTVRPGWPRQATSLPESSGR